MTVRSEYANCRATSAGVEPISKQLEHVDLAGGEADERQAEGTEDLLLDEADIAEQPTEQVRRDAAVAGGRRHDQPDEGLRLALGPPAQEAARPCLDRGQHSAVVDPGDHHHHPGATVALDGADHPGGLVVYLVDDDDCHLGLVDVTAVDELNLGPHP